MKKFKLGNKHILSQIEKQAEIDQVYLLVHARVETAVIQNTRKLIPSKYVLYEIGVGDEEENKWVIYRRFSDFRMLEKKLKDKGFIPITMLKPFIFRRLDRHFREKRINILNYYLHYILTNEDIQNSIYFYNFIRPLQYLDYEQSVQTKEQESTNDSQDSEEENNE